VRAGHPEPEFEERAGELVVRFIPTDYVPPHRMSHDLTDRQRRILHILRSGARLRAGEIRSRLSPSPSTTVLRDELNLLRSLELIEGSGHGAGARWWLKATGSVNRTE
jgi:ATP-dependent DNA helicase RecG